MPISITSKPQALAVVGEWVLARRARIPNTEYRMADSEFSIHNSVFPKIIVTPNPEIIVAAQKDPEFLKALQSADLAIPDGIGVMWAVSLLRRQMTKFSRLSGLDLMESLILQPQKVAPYELHPLKVMLLGGRPGVAQAAAKILSEQKLEVRSEKLDSEVRGANRVLKIKATSGPKDIANISKSENDRLIAQINRFSPDLLFVGFGHGKQEKWLTDNRERLTAGVAMAVGGAFDQIADPSLRPPVYINSIGMGWLYRLLRQPWRWRRQLALVRFVMMVLQKKILSSEHSENSDNRKVRKSDSRKAGNFNLLIF